MNGTLPPPIGNRHPSLAPHNRYRSAGEDAWIVVACETDAQFAALCATIGRPELATEARFATNAARKANEAELDTILESWTAARGHYEAMFLLQRQGVPAGAVLTIPELMADPHFRARGAWVEQTHADAGTWEMEAPPWRLSRTPGHIRLSAPGFAEHNSYVLRDVIGLNEAAIARLYAEGVTADTPDEGIHV
jgi:benzylsuccinate CoA-transferase BbsF subunit